MRHVYLPLLPVPVLAAIVAFAACSAPRSDEPPTHVVPPAIALPSMAPAPAPAPAARAAQEDPPSADDVAAFERHVAK